MGETSAGADETQAAEPGGSAGPAAADLAGAADADDAGGARTGGERWMRARVLVPLYAAVSVALTWPLALHLGDRLAYGAEPTSTVPLFNLWTLRWNQDRLGHGLAGYWDAPIFHPASGTFALSEPQPLTGLVFAPISGATGNPVLAFNLVALAVVVLNGLFGARLARHLGVGAGPAALTGVLALGTPFVASQLGVLQLTAVFPLVALVDALVRWAPSGGRKPAAEVGAWTAVTFLTCGYYGLFALVGVFPAALVLARRDWLTRSRLGDLAVAALCLAPAVPFVLAQADLTEAYDRSEETIEALSAEVADLFRLTGDAVGAGALPWVGDGGDATSLYMGTGLLVLGVAGAVVLAREAGERRRILAFLLLGALVTLLLSMGLNLSVFGFEPYEAVRSVVPGYDSLRSPFRFAALTEVFLVALAAFGIEDLWRWRPWPSAPAGAEATRPGPAPAARARRVGAIAAVGVVVLGVVEVSIAPVELFRVDRSTSDWVAWLDDRGPDDRPGGEAGAVVAFLPAPVDGKAASYAPTVRRMLEVLDAGEGVTTINGYSGLWPEPYEDWEVAAADYPTAEADILMRKYGVDLVVVDADWLADRPDVAQWLGYTYVEEFAGPDDAVYSVAPTDGAVVGG